MAQQHRQLASSAWLADEAAVKSQLVAFVDPIAQSGGAPVDGQASGPNPLFRFTARCQAQAGQDLLQALPLRRARHG